MQANGAEMLRLACCEAIDAGVTVCCPVHDAILIEADTSHIRAAVDLTQDIMREAGRAVLDGFEMESDAKIVSWPDRYQDEERGRIMWERVHSLATKSARCVQNGARCVCDSDTVYDPCIY